MSKISELSDGGVIQGGDTLIAVRSGGNVKVTYGGSTTANIDGGTIDGTTIGGTTPAAGSFTSLTSTGIDVTGTVTADGLTVDGGTTLNTSSTVFANLNYSNSNLGKLSTDGINVNLEANSNLFLKANSATRAKFDGNGDISFYEDTGTTAKLFWDASAESLGIGTSSPSTALHVQASSGASRITVGTGGVAGDHGLNVVSGGASNDYGIFFNGSMALGSKTTTGTQLKIGSNGTETTFQTLTFHTNATERMRIDSSGNVTVKASGADQARTLSLQGTNGASETYQFNLIADGENAAAKFMVGIGGGTATERMRIDSSGNLLVGTTDTTAFDGTTGINIGGNRNALAFSATGNNQMLIYSKTTGLQFYDATNNADRMLLDNSGNLLVGATEYPDDTVNNTTGFGVASTGEAIAATNGHRAAVFKRMTSDGSLVEFYKDAASVGSIGVNGGNNLNIGGSVANHAGLEFVDTAFYPQVAQVGSNGDVDLGGSLRRFKDLYLSGGAYLGGTGSANKLDDYEEGTWTPTVNSGSISGTSITYTGTYTKIGRQVYIYFNANSASADINISSYVTFSGLPFSITYLGTGTAITEDIDQFDRQGFATINATTLSISNAGSSSGTNKLTVGIVGTTS